MSYKKKNHSIKKYRNKELGRISSNHLLKTIPWAKMKCTPMTVPVFIAHSKPAEPSTAHPALRRHHVVDQSSDQHPNKQEPRLRTTAVGQHRMCCD